MMYNYLSPFLFRVPSVHPFVLPLSFIFINLIGNTKLYAVAALYRRRYVNSYALPLACYQLPVSQLLEGW